MSRISRKYFPNTAYSLPSSQGYAYMFKRDISLGIMSSRSTQEDYLDVTLEEEDAILESQLVKFILGEQYSRHNLTDAVIRFVNTLTSHLAAFGKIYIEIISNNVSKNLTNKSLGILPHGRVFRIFNRYAQIIPAKDRGSKESAIIWISSDRIWYLKLPSVLGSPRKHKRIMKRLGFLSQTGPMFIHEDGVIVDHNIQYDFMSHQRNKELAIENTVSVWGTIPSLSQIKGTTEYYYIVRLLQFSYCQALLREHIIREFNSLLARMNVRNNIQVGGLITANSIKDVMRRLHKGEIDFKEAIKFI